MVIKTAYRVGEFMAHRIVCTDCVAPILHRIKMGLSEVVPTATSFTAGTVCADCSKGLEGD